MSQRQSKISIFDIQSQYKTLSQQLQNMSQYLIVKQIIRNSLTQLKNTHSVLGTYLFANPYLVNQKQNISYPFIRLSQQIEVSIQQFNKILVSYRIPPTIFHCQLTNKALVFGLSYTSTLFSEQLILKKIQNLAESLNDKIRQLNENQLQEKQIRALLISSRNTLQACNKQIKDRSTGKIAKNQTISKFIDYLI